MDSTNNVRTPYCEYYLTKWKALKHLIMAQISHTEDFIMDFKLTDEHVDDLSDIIDSSEKNKVVNPRKRRSIGQKSKLLFGDILNKPYLKHESLPQLPQKPIANPLVDKRSGSFQETHFEELPELFNQRLASQLPPTVEKTLQASLPKQQLCESSQMFVQTLATQLRTAGENTLRTRTNSMPCTHPNLEEMFNETSDISVSRLMLTPTQRSVSVSIQTSDSSHFTSPRHPNYLTELQADKNSNALQLADIHEQLAVQNAYTTHVLEQQRQLEVYVKEKMENLDQGIFLIMRTLRQRERQINYKVIGTVEHYYEEMPKLPVSKHENVILLNYGLRNSDYMNKFVTQLSPLVKIFKRSTRKSIYSIMSKMFSLNLLVDYTWSGSQNTFTKASEPFSSLDGILKVINHMLGRYASGIEIESELKELLQCIPRIYCDMLKKQQKQK